MKRVSKILVVGAGPVGLSAAFWLKLKQLEFEIIDKKSGPTQQTKAIAINPRTLELFEEGGLSAKMIAYGNKLFAMNFRHGNQILLTMDFTKLHHRYNFLLALPQATTEMLLVDALQATGININWQHELVECHAEANSVRIIAKENEIRHIKHFDYCIGADGAHSAVRETQKFKFSGKSYPDNWSLVDINMDWPHSEHEANVFLHDDGVILFVAPLGNGHYRLVANTKYALEYLPLGCEIEKVIWQSNFSVHCRQVEKYQQGRILLAGDAAHVHSPAGGRGMNLGIEDAYELANMLAADDLKEYSTKRHAAGARVLADTDRLFRVASLKNPMMRYMRDHMLFNVFSSQTVQQKLMQRMAGITIKS